MPRRWYVRPHITRLDLDSSPSICDACQQAKGHQLPYSKSWSVSRFPLELVFSDVWGPAPVSRLKKIYYVSFVDDYNKFTWVYLLRYKSEVFQKFQEVQSLVERLFDRKILGMQTNLGGEYQKLNYFLVKLGYLILFLVLMLISRMAQLKGSIATL